MPCSVPQDVYSVVAQQVVHRGHLVGTQPPATVSHRVTPAERWQEHMEGSELSWGVAEVGEHGS